jgi:hypothetical protein
MKDRTRNDIRTRIAHIAARLMAEDGIEDHGLAKRKAARQAGAPDSRHLPTNEEVDEALRAYHGLYQGDQHVDNLRRLRKRALDAMRALTQFNPHLTGSVLSGSAGKYADIDLQLFADNVKAVEMHLINSGISYRTAQRRLFSGHGERTIPVYVLNDHDVEIRVEVLTVDDLRQQLRASPNGKCIERARLETVEAMLEREGPAPGP